MSAERHLARAVALFRAGYLDEAAAACRARLAEAADDDRTLELLGLIEGQRGDYGCARELLDRAARLRPGDAGVLANLGQACRFSGDAGGAVAAWRAALALEPGLAPARHGLAELLWQAEDPAAVDEFRALVAAHPGHADGWAGLARSLERQGETREAEPAAARALRLDPDHPLAGIVSAELALRSGDAVAARRRLERLAAGNRLTPVNAALVHYLLGQALDAAGDAPGAFDAWTTANRMLAARHPGVADAPSPYHAGHAAALRRLLDAQPPAPGDGLPPPVFLMGFPRSGTTLLERVLRAHPSIAVVEEVETLAELQRDFLMSPAGLERLLAEDAASLSARRRSYRQGVLGLTGAPDEAVVIDKMPLNTLFLPLIHRVFPDARVLFALRDPRDVCLSCFAQNFAINPAMANFLDLQATAAYYATVMGLGLDALDRLPLAVLRLRYEDLVSDLEGEARRAIAFLGLDWDPAVLAWRERLAGDRITTPSYRQVARPLYTSSRGRWRRYRAELAPVLPLLAPLVERLGYPAA